MAARSVVVAAFADVQPLDVAGPAEVFTTATALRPGSYAVRVVAPEAAPLRTASGYAITPAGDLRSARGPSTRCSCRAVRAPAAPPPTTT